MCSSGTLRASGYADRQTISGANLKNPNFLLTLKVLLVDDECDELELRAAILRLAGLSVLTAPGPIEALSLVDSVGHIDVAVIDYEMPYMNGGALAACLKAKMPHLTIALYSAAIGIPSRDLTAADAFIPKAEGAFVLLQYLSRVSRALQPIYPDFTNSVKRLK